MTSFRRKPSLEDRQRMAALLHFRDLRQVYQVVGHLRTIEEIRALPEYPTK